MADCVACTIRIFYFQEAKNEDLFSKLKSDKEYLIFKGKDINLKLREAVDESGEKQFVAKIVDGYDETILKQDRLLPHIENQMISNL